MTYHVSEKFNKIGAEADVANQEVRVRISRPRPDFDSGGSRSIVNVRGKTFVLRLADGAKALVLDSRPKEKHLLLMIKERGEKFRYLCGQDEKGWFAAAVPGVANSVAQAMENLQPQAVRELHKRAGSNRKDQFNRRSKIAKRQGEWFFIPMPAEFHRQVANDNYCILDDEPIQRGGSRAHFCEELIRMGGQEVWVTKEYPNGLTHAQYKRACEDGRIPNTSRIHARKMRRGARVFAKGRITANDHATLILPTWHEVIPNTENEAPGRQKLAFLD